MKKNHLGIYCNRAFDTTLYERSTAINWTLFPPFKKSISNILRIMLYIEGGVLALVQAIELTGNRIGFNS